MSTFFKRHKLLSTVFLALLFLIIAFEIGTYFIAPARLDEPISLSPPGRVEKAITVPLAEVYTLSLTFSFDRQTRQKVQELVEESRYRDGQHVPSGVAVPIRWSLLERHSGRTVSSEEKVSLGVSGFSATAYYRDIGFSRMQPGTYLFHAEALRDVPEFANIPTRIMVGLRPKATSHWLRELEFWATLVIVYVMWPLALLLGVILGGLYVRGPEALPSGN